MDRDQDHYTTLGVTADAPPQVVRAAYVALSKLHHPDGGSTPDERRMQEINYAWHVLRDPTRRAGYDATRAAECPSPRARAQPRPGAGDRRPGPDRDATAPGRRGWGEAGTDGDDPPAAGRRSGRGAGGRDETRTDLRDDGPATARRRPGRPGRPGDGDPGRPGGPGDGADRGAPGDANGARPGRPRPTEPPGRPGAPGRARWRPGRPGRPGDGAGRPRDGAGRPRDTRRPGGGGGAGWRGPDTPPQGEPQVGWGEFVGDPDVADLVEGPEEVDDWDDEPWDPDRDPTAVTARRVVAFGLDLALVALAAYACWYVVVLTLYDRIERSTPAEAADVCRYVDSTTANCHVFGSTAYFHQRSWPVLLAVAVPLFVLLVVVQGRTGATPGKALMALRTVREDGAEPGYARALVRTVFLVVVDLAFWCVPIVGISQVRTTVGHRRLGDKAARTYVVTRRAAGRPIVVPDPPPGALGPPY